VWIEKRYFIRKITMQHGSVKKEEILLYPYGCAKLRMTELPIIE